MAATRSKTSREPKTSNGHHHKEASANGHSSSPAAAAAAAAHPGWMVRISQRFVTLSLLACTLVAFAVGRTARMLLFINPQVQFMKDLLAATTTTNDSSEPLDHTYNIMKLPNPVLKNGKLPPPTLYTSKNFDTARSAAINSRWVVTEPGTAFTSQDAIVKDAEEECDAAANDGSCATCSRGKPVKSDGNNKEEEEVHLPVGQHLLMDIRHVDAAFLASEERLANAMLDVVGECGLTLLSYHCHGLIPAGVSCVGVLLESHVSFHTWPTEGVITLDLFTCGPNSLLPIVPKVEELFSVPRPGATHLMDMPEAIWAYKWRGYGNESKEKTAELTDLFTFPIGAMTEYKKEIASVYIGSDRIDIYDVLRSPYQTLASYKRLLVEETSYERQHPEVFQPDRIVFTNGVLQSRRSSMAAFYEMFVHPAMFTHHNPRQVAVVGFGDGAILREVLKHKSVEQVVLLDYDEALLNLTTQHFPEYNDCSFLMGPIKNCLDDPRVITYYGDTLDWFNDENKKTDVRFDVIIVDELELITGDDEVLGILETLCDHMTDEGVLVASMGYAPARFSAAIAAEIAKGFSDTLVKAGFESVRDYEEGHLGYEWPWRFALAFKDFDTRATWFRNEAATKIEIQKRIIQPSDGSLPLAYFDGATHSAILYPSRASEIEFCRRSNAPKECGASGHGFDPEIPNFMIDSALEARRGESNDLHVYAKVDIPLPSYVGLEEISTPIYFPPSSYHTFLGIGSKYYGWNGHAMIPFEAAYSHVYGHLGELEARIPSTLELFIDHGCKGSSNFGSPFKLTEEEADPDSIADEIWEFYVGKDRIYNPAAERLPFFYDHAVPLRAVQAGEQILVNKLASTGLNEFAWKAEVLALREKCSRTSANM